MVSVLHLVNDITSTSIPLEIAEKVHATTEVDIRVAVFYGDPKDADPETAEFGAPTIFLGGTHRFDLGAYARLRRHLTDVDIVHTHQNFVGSMARIVATTTDVKIVDTEHRNHGSFSLLQNLVNGPTLPLADKVVSNSEQTQASLRWYERPLIRDDKLTVIYNGINIEQIDRLLGAEDDGTPDGNDNQRPVRIISVGRMVPVKNYRTLIKAFAKAAEERSELELVLVGDGPERGRLEALAADLGVADIVEFIGFVPRKEVYRQLATSDIFAICSHSEGFCVAAVEAMAVGLPVVVSDIDVFREVIGPCGRFASPGSPEAFASAFVDLAADEPRRERAGANCKRRARSTFSLEETVRQHVALYEEVTQVNLSP